MAHPSFFAKSKEIFKYRELALSLVYRDLAERYKRSSLGFIWAVVEPLGLMLIYGIVFSFIVRLNISDYALFLLCGILPWIYFSKALYYSTESIVKDSHLVKKIYFPREILPLSSVLARLVNFIISLAILAVFLAFFRRLNISFGLLWLVLVITIQTAFIIGVVLALSALNVYFRDIRLLLEFLLLVWFYATPVFYPLSMVPASFRPFYILNPMAGITSAYREIILEGRMSFGAEFYTAFALSFFVFFAGFFIFEKLNKRIGELI